MVENRSSCRFNATLNVKSFDVEQVVSSLKRHKGGSPIITLKVPIECNVVWRAAGHSKAYKAMWRRNGRIIEEAGDTL